MKKVLLIAAFAVGTATYAVAAEGIGFGVKLGGGLTLASAEEGGVSIPTDGGFGFSVGGVADINISGGFSVIPGLNFAAKGQVDGSLYYFDVPVLASYAFSVTDNVKIRGMVGPMLGLGLGGIEGAFGDEGAYSRVNFALNFGAGVDIKRIYIGVEYSLGLSNIYSSDYLDRMKARYQEMGRTASDLSMSLSSFNLTLGYNF
jgi:hypothetical protein